MVIVRVGFCWEDLTWLLCLLEMVDEVLEGLIEDLRGVWSLASLRRMGEVSSGVSCLSCEGHRGI